MTARELSERMRAGGAVSFGDLSVIQRALTPGQLDRIKAKQAWEKCSMLGVLRDWPHMFEPSDLDVSTVADSFDMATGEGRR